MQKKHPREQKQKRRGNRELEKLFGLTTPLRINVLTGTPITPGGSTSIYDILYKRKYELTREDQERNQRRLHDIGLIHGIMFGAKGEKTVKINADKRYILEIQDELSSSQGETPPTIHVGFDDYAEAFEHVRTHMGVNALTNDQIMRAMGRGDGTIRANDLVFRLTIQKRPGVYVRWRTPPNLVLKTSPQPPAILRMKKGSDDDVDDF